MVGWKHEPGALAFVVDDLETPVGRAGSSDSVAIVSAAVAVFRVVRAVLK